MQRMQIPRLFGVLAASLVAVTTQSSAFPQAKTVPNELPRSWNLDDIAKATPPYGTKDPVYVLAWKVMQDERPLRVESCLVLKVFDKNEGYCLAHLYRHPTVEKPEWQLSMIHAMGGKGTTFYPAGSWLFHSERFKKKPGNKELYAALSFGKVNWSFEQEKGWKFVSCGVCEKSWQEAIGEKPTQFFGR